MRKFGENLRRVRKERGFTQEELAFKSGISLSQIARIEIGILNTSICTVYRIADTMEIDAGLLFR